MFLIKGVVEGGGGCWGVVTALLERETEGGEEVREERDVCEGWMDERSDDSVNG